jgi:surfactin synthase thioesterase subunit
MQSRSLPVRPCAVPRMRLFCFAYAGGGAAVFRHWRDSFGADIDVVAVELPGRGARFSEPAQTAMPELVASLLPRMAGQLALPFAFFGHSLGALVAYEVSKALRAAALPMPACLFASGANAPGFPRDARQLHALPTDELLAELGTYAGTPREVLADRELMDLLLPSIRADFALIETYQYRACEPLALPIRVLAGHVDGYVTAAGVACWRAETSSAHSVTWFDGGHFFIDSARNAVLHHMRAGLAELATTHARPAPATAGQRSALAS